VPAAVRQGGAPSAWRLGRLRQALAARRRGHDGAASATDRLRLRHVAAAAGGGGAPHPTVRESGPQRWDGGGSGAAAEDVSAGAPPPRPTRGGGGRLRHDGWWRWRRRWRQRRLAAAPVLTEARPRGRSARHSRGRRPSRLPRRGALVGSKERRAAAEAASTAAA